MNSLEDFILTYISEQTIIHPKDIKDKFQKKGYNMERITHTKTESQIHDFLLFGTR